MLFQLDATRFIQVYIVQGILFAFFLFLAYKILKRDKKRLNLMFAGSYISIVLGLGINFIYAPLTDEILVLVLYYITISLLFSSPVYLLIFNLILLKSEKIITPLKQNLIIIAFITLIILGVFFPNGVMINADTEWKPVYSLPLFIYFMLVMTGFGIIPTFFYAVKIDKKFEDKNLRKKWIFFIIGILFISVFAISVIISNFLNNPSFRLVIGLVGFVLVILGGYMMYYGVGKTLA